MKFTFKEDKLNSGIPSIHYNTSCTCSKCGCTCPSTCDKCGMCSKCCQCGEK